MITLRLASLIETHSQEITRKLLSEIRKSPRTADMRKIPELELRVATMEVLRQLREWLLVKTDADVQVRYRWLGEHWAWQGAALSDCCWTLMLTKHCLWEFLQEQVIISSGVEIYGEMELVVSLNRFFDSALCHLVEGYQQIERSEPESRRIEEPSWPATNAAAWVP
jgi:hypothetical protein